MVGIDIFSGKKYMEICQSTHNMYVPVVTRTELIVVDVGREYLSLMEDSGNLRCDLRVPEGDLAVEIRNKFENNPDDQTLVVSFSFFLVHEWMHGSLLRFIPLSVVGSQTMFKIVVVL